MNVFLKSLEIAKADFKTGGTDLSVFFQNSQSRKASELQDYCEKNEYLQLFRRWL